MPARVGLGLPVVVERMTRRFCRFCGNPLAPGTIHHLRARGPSVTVCRVVDVAEGFWGLAYAIEAPGSV